jgi:hypothetical protein
MRRGDMGAEMDALVREVRKRVAELATEIDRTWALIEWPSFPTVRN